MWTGPRQFESEGLRVELLPGGGDEHERAERALLEAGLTLQLPHRVAWARIRSEIPFLFLMMRDGVGRPAGGFAAGMNRSRALPGSMLLRVERFGHGLSRQALVAGLGALTQAAMANRRVLRVNLEVYSADPDVRALIGRTSAVSGYEAVEEICGYRNTLMLDLGPDEAALLASFNKTARYNIRHVAKFPLELRPIVDARWAERMDDLLRETMDRTGGTYNRRDLPGAIRLSNDQPTLSRIVGLFRTDREGPESLLAFSWGCGHGDYAHYATSASTRNTDLKVSVAYCLLWDLIAWARRSGAKRFDFGGITEGHTGSDDPLGGISDFKRYFANDVVTVGDEWVFEPHKLQARVARAVSAGAAWLSSRTSR